MAKSTMQQLDIEVSTELGVELAAPTVLKRILERKCGKGAFVFAYKTGDFTTVDVVELYSEVDGLRFKPERFILSNEVKQKLKNRTYLRWYFCDMRSLVPFQAVKVDLFLDSFNFYHVDNPCIKHLICNLDADFIRKKPLRGPMRNKPEELKIKVNRRAGRAQAA